MIEKDNALIAGILADAEAKAQNIISKAKDEAELIGKDGVKEAESALEAEERTCRFRLQQLELKEESAKRSIDRLAELRNMDSSYSLIMAEVDRRIAAMVKDGSIRKALVEWTVEAAIGLDRRKAVVSSSKDARVDETMLQEAAAIIKERTGAEIDLCLDEKLCSELGVVVSSEDGKVSYDNLLSVRKRRYLKDIRKIVQEENARQNSR